MGYMQGIFAHPGVVLANLIQPVADDPCLTLRPFSDVQTNPVLRVQNAAGTQDNLKIDRAGALTATRGLFGPSPSQDTNPAHYGVVITNVMLDDFSSNGNVETIAQVAPTTKYGASSNDFFLHNAVAPVPTVATLSVFSDGNLSDAGAVTAATWSVQDQINGRSLIVTSVGHGVSVNSPSGGEVEQAFVAFGYRTDRATIVHAPAPGMIAHQTEWWDDYNSGLVQMAVAANGRDWILDPTIGTQWGTVGGAAGQKQAWWGAAPIVQPLLATGALRTPDDIITVLQALGLCRQT